MGTVRYTVIDGEVIAEKRNGVRSLYVPDPLGSTVALLDNTQAKTDTFSYWPYGENDGRTGTTATPFQFVGAAGYYRDNSLRAYVRARTLYTAQGRWTAVDPLARFGLNTNPYVYARNNPATFIDPTGAFALAIPVGSTLAAEILAWCWINPILCGAILVGGILTEWCIVTRCWCAVWPNGPGCSDVAPRPRPSCSDDISGPTEPPAGPPTEPPSTPPSPPNIPWWIRIGPPVCLNKWVLCSIDCGLGMSQGSPSGYEGCMAICAGKWTLCVATGGRIAL